MLTMSLVGHKVSWPNGGPGGDQHGERRIAFGLSINLKSELWDRWLRTRPCHLSIFIHGRSKNHQCSRSRLLIEKDNPMSTRVFSKLAS